MAPQWNVITKKLPSYLSFKLPNGRGFYVQKRNLDYGEKYINIKKMNDRSL